MRVTDLVESTRVDCLAALASPLAEVGSFLARQGASPTEMLRECSARGAAPPPLLELQRTFSGEGGLACSAFARTLLLHVSLPALDRISTLPVPDSVKRMLCEQLAYFAQTPVDEPGPFLLTQHPFVAMSRLALLERFPGGQHDWEISGFSRRWLASVGLRQLPRLAWMLLAEAGGNQPFFVQHMAVANRRPRFCTEREYLRFFYRMAASIAKQPSIRAIMGCSWLHSLETHRINPHLAFFNRPHLEAGGVYFDIGPAPESAGFLIGSKDREALYGSGQFRPTLGVVVCSRRQAMRWMDTHPELGPDAA
jgi:hypothetical protein